MTSDRFAETIAGLTAGLTPVRRLPRPSLRAVAWVAGAIAVSAILYAFIGGGERAIGFGRPYVAAALIAAVLTAILAAVAAFQLSLPDRSAGWLALPLPALVAWIAASGLGCLAGLASGETWGTSLVEVGECFAVILGVSIPVSALMITMLRRAAPLRPSPVAAMGGLAAAAAAGAALILVHPHNSTVLDLAIHAGCICLVIAANRLFGGRLLGATSPAGL